MKLNEVQLLKIRELIGDEDLSNTVVGILLKSKGRIRMFDENNNILISKEDLLNKTTGRVKKLVEEINSDPRTFDKVGKMTATILDMRSEVKSLKHMSSLTKIMDALNALTAIIKEHRKKLLDNELVDINKKIELLYAQKEQIESEIRVRDGK